MGGLQSTVPLVMLAGCHLFGFDTPVPVRDGSPAPDLAADDGPGPTCFGHGFEIVCLAALPTATLSIDQNTPINTDSSAMCVPTTSATVDACVIAGQDVTISGTLAATGGRPLVIVAIGTISIKGSVDVSSKRNGFVGPGADAPHCLPPMAPMGVGGGAGGSFGGKGGSGGPDVGGATGATAAPAEGKPTTFHGGCPGGDGAGMQPGVKGHGGGAIDLIASSITVAGTIDASGEGGGGGALAGGGAGGGSGGTIAFDAMTVTIDITAQVFANGAGGGGGGAGGEAGHDPAMAGSLAVGGVGGTPAGGNGGSGSVGIMLDGTPGVPAGSGNSGGGGGGGAAGAVVFQAQSVMITGQVSPRTQ